MPNLPSLLLPSTHACCLACYPESSSRNIPLPASRKTGSKCFNHELLLVNSAQCHLCHSPSFVWSCLSSPEQQHEYLIHKIMIYLDPLIPILILCLCSLEHAVLQQQC